MTNTEALAATIKRHKAVTKALKTCDMDSALALMNESVALLTEIANLNRAIDGGAK